MVVYDSYLFFGVSCIYGVIVESKSITSYMLSSMSMMSTLQTLNMSREGSTIIKLVLIRISIRSYDYDLIAVVK